MGDLTLQHVVLRIGAALLIVSVHGGALAAMVCLMGDPEPRQDGRLGLNPSHHLDLIGGLLIVLFTFGWIRPIAADPDRLRFGRAGLLAVVAGASCATLALAILLWLIRPFVLNMLPDTAAATFFIFVQTVGQLCVSSTLFNLLPMPPLTGEHLLVVVWPRQRNALRRAQPYCAGLLALLIAAGFAERLLGPVELAVERTILND
jgi:Zn-dependent protease